MGSDNPPEDSEHGWIDLLRSVREQVGSKLPGAMTLIGISSVLEGAGLVLLLPIAEVVFSQGSESSGVSSFVVPILNGIGADSILKQLALLSALFMGLMIVRAWVLLKRDVMLMQLSQGYVDNVRHQFFASLAKADWPVIKRFERAQLLDSMTTNIGRISAGIRFLTQGIVTLTLMLAYLASAFIVSTTIGLVLIVMTVIVGAMAYFRLSASKTLGDRMTHSNRGVMRETTRFLDGLKAAKACQAEGEFTKRFRASIDETRYVSVAFVMQQARIRRSIELVGALFAIGLLIFGYGVLGLSGAELLILGAIVIRMVPGLVTSFSGVQSLAFALPAYSAAAKIKAQIDGARKTTDVSNLETGTEIIGFNGIILNNISVSAGNGSDRVDLVKTDILEIPGTGLVHISGPSGAGKSTLVELIAGLHHCSTGAITIATQAGSVELTSGNHSAWQQSLSYAPQEPFLFDGSVRDNIAWPNIEASDDDIWQALTDAQVDSLVRALPAQLDEQLLDGGNRLSGGERQRLCLARALLRPSKLLILDEATSAVDSEIELEIQKNLAQLSKQKTVLLVSHAPVSDGLVHLKISVDNGFATIED